MTKAEAIESIEGIKSYYTDDRDFSYYGDEYEGLTDDDNEALDMGIKALEQTRWIPISERLPEDGTWNCFTDGKHISVERYKSDAIDHFFPDGRWFSLEEAVAWMPLPEPYKAETKIEQGLNFGDQDTMMPAT